MQQWLVKDNRGRIYGPVESQRICELIDRAILTGDEQVSPYPGGEWQQISQVPEFYDRVLAALSAEVRQPQEPTKQKELTKSVSQTGEVQKIETMTGQAWDVGKGEAAPTEKPKSKPRKGMAVREEPRKSPESGERPGPTSSSAPAGPKPPLNPYEPTMQGSVIELTSQTDLIRRKKNKRSIFPLLVFLVALFAAYLILNEPQQVVEDTVGDQVLHLVLPKKKKESLSKEQAAEAFKQAGRLFATDTLQGYLRAENLLVRIIEDSALNADHLELLCLTYREIWPYTPQDSKDLSVLSQVVQMTSQVDPMGQRDATCKTVQKILSGQFDSLESQIKSNLSEYPDVGAFYEMKGQLLADLRDYSTAILYIQKTQQVWPRWLKPYVLDARFRVKLKQFPEARKQYEAVMQANPKHAVATVELGLLEFFHFNNEARALELIRTGLDLDRLPRGTAALAYEILARTYAQRKQRTEALQFAEKAYKLDPSNLNAREILRKLGGDAALAPLKTECQELLALGDQYLKKGNYLAAQAEFRSGFDICDPPNAVAALKAAQALWKLNQSHEAVLWAQKAIQVDKKLIEAYVLLADFQSQQFDFIAAGQILRQAQKVSHDNFEVYRGMALVEFRRGNFKDAIRFAEQTLKLFDTDVETHLILVRALMASKDYRRAYQFAARAIELDSHNQKAQALYAEVLGSFQGVEAATGYLRKLINTYPAIPEYRMAYGDILKRDEKFSDAAEMYKQVVTMEPNNKTAYLNLGDVHFRANHVQEALRAYLTAAELDPSDAYPAFLVGQIFLQIKSYGDATRYFQKALRVNEKYPGAHHYLGRIHFLTGNLQDALKEATSEKRINPNMADPYLLAGEIYMKQGAYSKAVEELQRAVKIRNQSADIYILLGRAYRLSGSLEIATSMLNIAVAKESGNPEIYKELGAVYSKSGQNEQAIRAFERYIELAPTAADRDLIQQQIQALGGG